MRLGSFNFHSIHAGLRVKGINIYKVFVNLSSPANKSVELWVKRELEIEGV